MFPRVEQNFAHVAAIMSALMDLKQEPVTENRLPEAAASVQVCVVAWGVKGHRGHGSEVYRCSYSKAFVVVEPKMLKACQPD